MEDFGYSKNEEKNTFGRLAKRVFLVGATLFSITCFIYVTINAYYFVYSDKNSDIETIKAPEGPIKIIGEEQIANSKDSMQINRSIYEDIFGSKKESFGQVNTKIRNDPAPAIPPKATENKNSAIKTSDSTIPTSEKEKPTIKQEQKIIVYSDKPDKENVTKDLLTKNQSVEEGKILQKQPAKRKSVRVQIAAMTSKLSAEEYGSKLKHLYPDIFSGLKFFIEEVNLGKRGIFYRLQVDNFYNQIEAEDFCNHYTVKTQKSKADCIVVE